MAPGYLANHATRVFNRLVDAQLPPHGVSLTLIGPIMLLSWKGPMLQRHLPGENDPRWMDLTIAHFTIARPPDDDRLWRWHHATGGRSISLRPDRHGTARAIRCL
ncbi:hypothetical protein GGR62_003472 [Xanthomonas campestris]|nr:hypothetical protein [Xanthomonas sp. 3075]